MCLLWTPLFSLYGCYEWFAALSLAWFVVLHWGLVSCFLLLLLTNVWCPFQCIKVNIFNFCLLFIHDGLLSLYKSYWSYLSRSGCPWILMCICCSCHWQTGLISFHSQDGCWGHDLNYQCAWLNKDRYSDALFGGIITVFIIDKRWYYSPVVPSKITLQCD